MINWKVRVKNKTFWLALIPALLLLARVDTDRVTVMQFFRHMLEIGDKCRNFFDQFF